MFCVSCRGHHISAGQGQFLQEPFPIRGDLTLRPSEDLAGFIVRLEDDMETMLGDLEDVLRGCNSLSGMM